MHAGKGVSQSCLISYVGHVADVESSLISLGHNPDDVFYVPRYHIEEDMTPENFAWIDANLGHGELSSAMEYLDSEDFNTARQDGRYDTDATGDTERSLVMFLAKSLQVSLLFLL